MKINNLGQIASDYDAYIIDLWGVLHNGQWAFPEAVLALAELKMLKKKVILLSNSPRRIQACQNRLSELGILPEFYDEIYTSGEDCFQALNTPTNEWYRNLGNKYFHIGPDKNKSLAQELKQIQVEELEEADFILVTGTNSWEIDVSSYVSLLKEARKKYLPMICANPDLTVLFDEKVVICAGAIAQYYEQIGGDVRYHGKPYGEIYDVLLQKILPIQRNQILAIGDSLKTDIKGAAQQGIDTLLILSGVHAQFQGEPFEAIRDYGLENFAVEPTFVADKLVF